MEAKLFRRADGTWILRTWYGRGIGVTSADAIVPAADVSRIRRALLAEKEGKRHAAQ